MIKRLKIKDFRGIKEGEIKLAPLTILTGANNSGKTTILEALFLAPNPFREVPYMMGRYHLAAAEVVHSMHKTLGSQGFAFLLNKYIAKQAEIECEINGDKYLLQFIKMDSWIHISTNKEMRSYYTITVGDKTIKYYGWLAVSDFSTDPLDTKLFIENTLLISSNLIKAGYDYLEENWASIINLGVCKRVAEETSMLSPENYKDITIEPFLGKRLAIYAYLEDGTRIRLGDLGEGIQNYILARILYEVEKPKVLLWDDVEAHFNPRILLSIAEWFSDMVTNGNQVILTTHSLEAARTIAGLSEENAKIYLLSLDNNILRTKELTLKEIEELLETGVDVRVAEPLLL